MTSTADNASSTAGAETHSASEELLFGGRLDYDQGWNQHRGTWVKLGMWSMALSFPRQVAVAVPLARQADRRALYTVAVSEFGRGLAPSGMDTSGKPGTLLDEGEVLS
ncbi:hypothetical protein ACFW96_23160 [Streptomyces gardneri]|uniref:hypothetical protein n=1 Tax=Streptomyces gardneri TaxID=66892 RepID=UPI0036B08210